MRECLSFDDVLLVPQHSNVKSRSEVNIESRLGNTTFPLPIVSSPMDTITETEMALAMGEAGGLGIIHRYCSIAEQVGFVSYEGVRGAAIGITGDYLERVSALYGAGIRIFCLDVAHGDHVLMRDALEKLKEEYGEGIHVMAGNVATRDAYERLSDWGADSIRVGIGGGSICSTRIQTGHGCPTFQSVLDCSQSDRDTTIIADGGIKSSGDMVKALAAGADFVMVGSLLAGTAETPGELFESKRGKKYKVYRGMASKEAQKDWRGTHSSNEGISTTVPFKGSVGDVLEDLENGIRSGLSYSGARTIYGLQFKAQFVRQTPAGLSEGTTHILRR
tara:strand:- start:516 stop:1514 length:999 start_codon:yes stop_codon:yes gene_type:complete